MDMKRTSAIVVFAGFLFFVVQLFDLFILVDWGQGVARAGILLLITSLCVSSVRLLRTAEYPTFSPGVYRLVVGVTLVSLCFFGHIALETGREISRTNIIPLDQGQNVYRSYLLLRSGDNPYSANAMLDPDYYLKLYRRQSQQTKRYLDFGECEESVEERLFREWHDFSLATPAALSPKVLEDSDGGHTQRLAKSLGYKYGPALLLLYAPFIELFAKPGIIYSHWFYLALMLCFVLFAFRKTVTDRPPAMLALLVVFLLPKAVMGCFEASASDLIPTLLAMSAWLAMNSRRFLMLGVVLAAVSMSCKIMPGLVLLPVVFSRGLRPACIFSMIGLLFHAPFYLWEPQGFVNNVLLFNLLRETDSTALRHFLSSDGQMVLKVVVWLVILILSFTLFQHRRNRFVEITCVYGLCTAILLGSQVMHNNYFIGIQGLIGVGFFLLVTQSANISSPPSVPLGTDSLEPVSKPRFHQFPPGVSRRLRDAGTVMKRVLATPFV